MSFRPLAERLRPTSIDDYIGQEHLVSPNAPLRKAFDKAHSQYDTVGSARSRKTTLAKIIANKIERPFYVLSAVSSGVKDVRETIAKAEKARF